MAVQPRRPTENERIYKRVKGEVVCAMCSRPVGHPRCPHLTAEQIWMRLVDLLYTADLRPLRTEKWGIAYPLDPPQHPKFHGDRWVMSKGEDGNFHYIAPNGWELHIRKNDNSGYHYSIHYEISPDYSKSDHASDIFRGYTGKQREQKRRLLRRSTYTEPEDLEI